MSSRFLQKDFLQCSKCNFVHRYARGYKPIGNPILFNSDQQCRDYFNEIRASTGYQGIRLSCKCPSCEKLHTEWKWVDFQSFLRMKESMSRAEQAKYLAKTNPRGSR